MLGYTGSSTDSKSGTDYGSGNGVYWLNNVQCAGNEKSIFSCAHDGLKKQACANGKEAKVVCVGHEGQKLKCQSKIPMLERGKYVWVTNCDK